MQLEADALRQLVDDVTEAILGGRTQAQDRTTVAETLGSPITVADLASRIDHTNLNPEATTNEIATLCGEARTYAFAAVCVQPIWVGLAERILRGSAVAVCTVVGFPSGATPTRVKCVEAELALGKGARELDMVVPVGLLRDNQLDRVKQDIAEVVAVTHAHGALLKVILETATLNSLEIAVGCALARLAGADYVKTSTGFHRAGGATEAHVALMRQVVGADLGVKAAGGIRSAAAATKMLAAGASRIGTSAGVQMVQELDR